MLGKGLVSGMRIGAAMLAAAFVLGSCTSMITEEQLKKLEQLKQKESELNSQIKKRKTEISDLEKDLNEQKAKLQKCQKESEFVNEKLAKWPDCWPDWSPYPPKVEEPPVEQPGKKKIK
jgi:septal ring factor EnvC (AmiA/AmiB activator)